MSLVGDILIRARTLARDPCLTLQTPAQPPVLSGAGGGSLPNVPIFYVVTWLTPYGETIASGENKATPPASGQLSGTIPTVPGATAGRLYYSTISGGENQWVPVDPVAGTVTITSLLTGQAGYPPPRNRAYLPDTDGEVSAIELYKWMNAGLFRLGQITGGILDQSGIFWRAGAAEAVLPGYWLEITDTWHDGWVVLPERAEFTWLKSTLQSIPGIITTWKNAAQQIVGLWPQPGTPGAQTTLSSNVGLTTDPFPVVDSSGFQPPDLFMVDNEIISCTSNADQNGVNDQLGLLVRGYGGSVPATHQAGAEVNELIFRFRGYRMPVGYSPGQSGAVLDLPAAWDEPVDRYILSKFKEWEQNRADAKDLMQDFDACCIQLRNNKMPPPGVRQVGWVAPFVGDAENLETLIGTILIP